MYIAFEGPDGVGKTTQLYLLEEYLKGKGKKVMCVREPGGTRFGEALRGAIFRDMPSPEATLLAMYSARIELHREVIGPALKKGNIVLSDRSSLSSWMYQYSRNETILYEHMESLEELVDIYRLERPYIFFITEPDIDKKYTDENNFDKAFANLGQEITEAGLEYLPETSNGFTIIDGSSSINDIATEVKKSFNGYFGERK